MRCFRTFFAGLVLCGVAISQEAAPPPDSGMTQSPANSASSQATQASPAQTNSSPRIAPGSVIPVQLTKTIDAKRAKTGDQVTAKVTQDMRAVNGQILVAKDTKVVGHVTEAQARSKEQSQSQVGIAFDHVVTKQGDEESLPMSIQAIIAPASLSSSNANGGGDNGSSGADRSAGGMTPGNASGRSAGMGIGVPQQAPSSMPAGSGEASAQAAGTNAHQPITGNTQGVVGISNLTLSTTSTTPQGSLLVSDKNNVKLDSGTLILLRVSQ